MFFLNYSVWFINFILGFLSFRTCYRTTFKSYMIFNISMPLLVILVHMNVFFIEKLHLILTCIPVLISVLKFSKDFTQESREYEKSITKIILFLDLVATKTRFGRGLKESLSTSQHVITNHSHVILLIQNNVVLQQPKSRFFTIFSDLEHDLNLILLQKVSQKDLILLIKKKYQKKLSLHQKTKIALSQYKSQSFVISFFWICALAFLISQGLFLKHLNIILFSFSLLCAGIFMSKKLLVTKTFRT